MSITQIAIDLINNPKNKYQKIIKNISIISLGLFLVYFTNYTFLPEANRRILLNIYKISIILLIIYYFILIKVINYYNKTLNFLISKFDRIKLKNIDNITSLSWLIPSILLGLGSIILFIIFNYYITKERTNLNLQIDYTNIAVSINLTALPVILILSLIFMLFSQSLILKLKKVKLSDAFFVSILTNLVFIIIIWLITNVIKIFLGML